MRDEDEPTRAGRQGLVDRELQKRCIVDRQQLLGGHLGGRKHPRAEARDGEDNGLERIH